MILKFTTKRDINGNRYTLKIDIDNKIVLVGYNTARDYSDYFEITKKSLNKMQLDFESNGFLIKHI